MAKARKPGKPAKPLLMWRDVPCVLRIYSYQNEALEHAADKEAASGTMIDEIQGDDRLSRFYPLTVMDTSEVVVVEVLTKKQAESGPDLGWESNIRERLDVD